MKPCSFKTFNSSNYLNATVFSDFGTSNTVAGVKGTTKKLGSNYSDALVVLYTKNNLLPIASRKPNSDGEYQFLGLNNSLLCFIVAFDNKKQYNAVIQDQVVPK